ncbi:TonB-dependent receptor [Undibacterium sp. Tian12W]|uniref:TonB-dependent receptor n=1 Tax=Undibacterium sp. Tian12W TaxID=3413054 RepID=UPI003BF36E1C
MKVNAKNKLSQQRRYQQLGIVLAGAALSIGTVAAEESSPRPSAEEQATLPSVTVTATRREASLRSVPVAISVLNGDLLEQANRNSIDSIVAELPSVNFRQQGGNKDSTIFVRGIGTISTSPGVEPTVSTVVDGVVYARPGQATLDLLDIDRIEVLRGPQGTLFGKNASSGVFNILSRKPSIETTGFIDASYFEGNEKRLRAGVSGTLAPNLLSASFTVLDSSYEGNVDNLSTQKKVNGYDRKGARAKFLLTPNNDLDISVIADYLRSNSSPTYVVLQSTNAPLLQAISPVRPGLDNRQVVYDLPNAITDFNKGLSAQVDWRNQGYTWTSITAARQWDNEQRTTTSAIGNSADVTRINAAFPATRDIGTLHYSQFSQELRLASPKDAAFEYVAGAYYLHGKDEETYQRIVTTSPSAINYGYAPYSVKTDSYSLFGEGNYKFSPDWKLLAGLRWTRDEVAYEHARISTQTVAFPGVQPATANAGSTTESAFSGRIGLQFDISKSISSYATLSRGYKGPAYNVFFNMLNRDTLALKPELSDSFEVGIKALLLDRKLSFNVAAFQTNYSNYQANFYDTVAGAVVTRLINAGEVSTRGVELEVEARPIPRLNLSASLAYIDARIDQFNCPAAAAASCNLNGQTLPFSPKWKSFARASYAIPLNNGLQVDVATDFSWQSKVQYDLFQSTTTIQGSVGLWNASVALSAPDNGWRLALIAKNLGDKSYATNLVNGTNTVTRAVPRDDQRYFGVNLRKDF